MPSAAIPIPAVAPIATASVGVSGAGTIRSSRSTQSRDCVAGGLPTSDQAVGDVLAAGGVHEADRPRRHLLGIDLAVARWWVIQQHSVDLPPLPMLEPALVECVGMDAGATADRQQQHEQGDAGQQPRSRVFHMVGAAPGQPPHG